MDLEVNVARQTYCTPDKIELDMRGASRISNLYEIPIQAWRPGDPVYKPEPKRQTVLVRTASKEPPNRRRKR